MSRIWTPTEQRQVAALHRGGATYETLAEAFGTTPHATRAICRALGATAPPWERDPAPSEAWLLPLLDRYPYDYTDPKARVRRAELDRRQRARL